MANVKVPQYSIHGITEEEFRTKHKPLYHAVLHLDNKAWELLREKASQKGGNVASHMYDNIKEKVDHHIGRRSVFKFIAGLNTPAIAARIIERVPKHLSETGGNFVDQLHQLMEPDKYPDL